MRRSRAALVALLILAAALIGAPAAFAHARLVGTSPETGTTVKKQPAEVIFKFDQPVGGDEGAVRVYDAAGQEVDDGDVEHPGGKQSWLGVGLEPGLADGTYTATYRVISADTHIVDGGLTFNLGHASKGGAASVAGLIGEDQSGEVTKLAFGVVRFLDYVSIALMVGGLIFLAFAFAPGLAEIGGEESRLRAAGAAMRGRAVPLLAFAVALGLVVSLLGILLQGASAAGVSLWSSLKWSIVEGTLDERFGTVWLLRAIDWAALGVVGLAYLKVPRARRRLTPLLMIGCAYLVTTPAFAGHPSVESPVAVMFPADVIHVLASSVWVGGVAFLVLALPAAARALEPPGRTRLLLATLARFSPIALGSVVALAVTGLVQAYIDVRHLSDLVETTYGLLVLAKMVLLAVLIGFGWVNKDRIIPRLRGLVEGAAAPGSVGDLARRNLRGELGLMLVVFGVTAALIAYTPPIDAPPGPFSTTTRIGAAELKVTVEPAEVGLNEVRLELVDPQTGAPFTRSKEVTMNARLPAKGIGPLKLEVKKGGPGEFVAFDEFAQKVEVPIG